MQTTSLLKLPRALLELLWFTPVIYGIAALINVPVPLYASIAWLFGATLFGTLAGLLKRRMRLIAGIAVPLAWLAAWVFLGPESPTVYRFCVAACGIGAAFATARLTPLSMAEAFSSARWIAGLILYTIAWVLLFFSEISFSRPMLSWLSLVYGLCMLLFMNRSTIQTASFQKNQHAEPVPRSLLSGNRIIVAAVCVVVFIAANIGWLARIVGTAAGAIAGSIVWLFGKLASLFIGESIGDTGEPVDDNIDLSGLGGETKDPGPLAEIIETALFVFVVLVLLVALFFVGRYAYKTIKRLTARLREALSKYRDAMTADYTDEVVSLASLDGTARELANRLRDRFRAWTTPPVQWRDLNNTERVRFAFGALVKNAQKRGVATETRTPSEMLSDQALIAREGNLKAMVGSYEEARYSAHDITDDQAENARKTANLRK